MYEMYVCRYTIHGSQWIAISIIMLLNVMHACSESVWGAMMYIKYRMESEQRENKTSPLDSNSFFSLSLFSVCIVLNSNCCCCCIQIFQLRFVPDNRLNHMCRQRDTIHFSFFSAFFFNLQNFYHRVVCDSTWSKSFDDFKIRRMI